MSGTTDNGAGYRGSGNLLSGGNEFNAISFLIEQVIAGKAFASMVKVMSVTGGGTGQPPIVSVHPMVDQIDGAGKQHPHGTVYNIPCFRLQGGNGAIILDPAIGDIGQAIICHNDISKVKATSTGAGPGSFRRNDWSDGCYFGGFLNGGPTQYVQFAAGGMNITTTGTVTINAPGNVTVVAPLATFSGNINCTGSITATGGVKDAGGSLAALRAAYDIHRHTGVTTGAGTTGTTDTPA